MMTKEQDAARKEFVSEAEELLESLSGNLIEYESGFKTGAIKPALVNKIFREMHSLKGLAGMLGFQKISDLSHELESLLDKLRMGKLPASQPLVNTLFGSLDTLRDMVSSIARDGTEGLLNIVPTVSQIHDIMSEKPQEESDVSLALLDLDEGTKKSFTEYEEHRLIDNIKQGFLIYSVSVEFAFDVFDTELKLLADAINEKGEVISTLPSGETSSPDKIGFCLISATKLEPNEFNSFLESFKPAVKLLVKERPKPAKSELAPTPRDLTVEEEPAAEQDDLKSISPTVRVAIEKLDNVMNIVGELVVSKSAITRISRQVATESGFSPLTFDLIKSARQLDRKLGALQESVIDVRMVPVGQIFNKLSRSVRKIAGQRKKLVNINFFGGDTELDKVMIEEITNPLIHLLRNAIDHGIENPEERRAKKKTEVGEINLRAYQRGNSVAIDISDDGAGISVERIKEIAVEKGILQKGAEIGFEDCVDLIFSPGFSSAREVSDVSGRGVGLDVVKSNITRLKGAIQVFSEVGAGTTFQITLPITLAILQTLLVMTGGRRFAIPLTSVQESIRITPEQIRTVEHREVYHLRDITLPLIRLNRFFNLPEESGGKGRLYIVVVQSAERKAGFVVDRLAGEQEVVIKSIGKILSGLPGIAGVCELGENELVLVMDVGSLLEKVYRERDKVFAAKKEAFSNAENQKV